MKEYIRSIVVFLLTREARAILKKYQPKIILVTGGVGKTLAKDAIYATLATSFFVRRSEKSYGSDIGAPLTVLGVPEGHENPFQWAKNIIEGFFLICMNAPYPEWLVIEIGADRPGDITKKLSWLKPDILVATRFPEIPAHVEFYASPEAVFKEELAPSGWLSKEGVFIGNSDDARTRGAQTNSGVGRLMYGFEDEAEVRANRFHTNSRGKMPSGISFDVNHKESRVHISLNGVIGKQHAYPVLAGLSAAIATGISLEKAAKAFEKYETQPGRMRIILGMRDSVIVDDSYNASPTAMKKALSVLSDIPRTGKRIAVLGDMLELGAFSVDEHSAIGAISATATDILMTVGVRARDIARGARESGMPAENIIECERVADTAGQLTSLITAGDVILIKGSRAIHMERIVKAVMREPQKAGELLVG